MALQLHHGGATCSHTIAPVTYMWRPHKHSEIIDVDKGDGIYATEAIKNSSALRLVWIWIHAAAFREGFDALECASRREVRYIYLNPFLCKKRPC